VGAEAQQDMRRFWRWLTNLHDTWGVHEWEKVPGTFSFSWGASEWLEQCKVEGCGAVRWNSYA
jgi:NADH dehydrogenase/NADH:ubiquinone oxidoreductase subunit G